MFTFLIFLDCVCFIARETQHDSQTIERQRELNRDRKHIARCKWNWKYRQLDLCMTCAKILEARIVEEG